MLTHYAEGARTIVSVPLPGMPELPGALVLGWRTPVNPTAAQLKFAETLSSYTALIVANMRARGRGRSAAREARAKAEELAASEARLRTLYEALSCGVLVKDAEGRVLHVNAAAEDILGYRLEQMLGKTTDTLWQTLSDDGTILSGEDRPSAVAIKSSGSSSRNSCCAPNGSKRRAAFPARWLTTSTISSRRSWGIRSSSSCGCRQTIPPRHSAMRSRMAPARWRASTRIF
jgi:hypothetical protein